jgi:protein ImuB
LPRRRKPDVSDVIDILANRVGEDRLYRFAPVQSDVPERSVQRIAPMAPDTGEGWPGHWPRPSRLLPRPEPIETMALLPDHPPVTFTWRGVRRRVKRADGPERVFGEWWKRDAELAAVRDYFQVEDENGERYWLEAEAVVSGFQDVAVVRQPVEQAVVILASPKTPAHSEKLRLVVMATLVRS